MNVSESQPKFKDLFVKDIDRDINGVIKANDEQDLANEVDEYVLTGEIQQNLETFLEDYNDPTNHFSNGAWISGFFGSGKSHLLKMLSHILGEVPRELVDRESTNLAFTRQQIVRTFMEKAHEQEDEMLVGELERTLNIPATSILFNIDQKADKSNPAALLNAFIRVFDEARGYFGKDPEVAKFERDLENNGLLEAFERSFEVKSGNPWTEGREAAILWSTQIEEAYAEVTGRPAPDSIIQRYENSYTATVSDFANDVAAWLKKQENNHRVIFLVDEVGQFIGENADLMLQLQSVAEDLATKTNGRAWVVVTSQEDIDTIVGDRSKQQSYDFSKIQARFAIKLKLNSADVIEVIQKRLLDKKPEASGHMHDLWSEYGADLRTMFEFTAETSKFNDNKAYEEADFSASYPFMNYEFGLFQNALRQMSLYNMFDGRHASVGERSMLSSISSTLRSSKEKEIGEIVSFDELYDGIRDAIQSTSNYRIREAQDRLDPDVNEIGVRLLKVLLLVKHVDGFPTTLHNLRVLLTDRFGMDVLDLENQIRKALQELEHDTYVRRVGEEYQYLTNEEQDVEQEIKNVDIDYSKVLNQFKDMLVSGVIGSMSVQHGPQKTPFRYGLKIDKISQTSSRPIWLNVITAQSEADRANSILESMGARDSITLLIGANDSLLFDDLEMYEKTRTYLTRMGGSQIGDVRSLIIEGKRGANENLNKELTSRISRVIEEGEFYYNGERIDVKAAEAQTYVTEGIHVLIERYYTNFTLLGGLQFSESDLPRIIMEASESQPGTLDGTNAVENTIDAPANDLLSFIQRETNINKRTITIKSVIEKYQSSPYGWPYGAILACLGHLYGGDHIELDLDGKLVQRTEAASFMRNTKKQESIIVSIPRVFDAQKVSRLKDFSKEFLNISAADIPSSPMDLVMKVKEQLADTALRISQLQSQQREFNFVDQLSEPVHKMEYASRKDQSWLLDDFLESSTPNSAEELLDIKDDLIDPVFAFFNGAQAKVFSENREWLNRNRPNVDAVSEIVSQEFKRASELENDPNIFRGNKVNQFKIVVSELRSKIDAAISEEREKAREIVETVKENVQSSKEYGVAAEAAQDSAIRKLDAISDQIDSNSVILSIREQSKSLQENIYPQLMNQLAASAPRENIEEVNSTASETARPEAVPSASTTKQSIFITKIAYPHAKSVLETIEDIDNFLDAYRTELTEAINSGKKILL
jgi:hypothetical protein